MHGFIARTDDAIAALIVGASDSDGKIASRMRGDFFKNTATLQSPRTRVFRGDFFRFSDDLIGGQPDPYFKMPPLKPLGDLAHVGHFFAQSRIAKTHARQLMPVPVKGKLVKRDSVHGHFKREGWKRTCHYSSNWFLLLNKPVNIIISRSLRYMLKMGGNRLISQLDFGT